MMTFIRDFWKSFLLGALGALVLVSIGFFIYDRLVPNTPREVADTVTPHDTTKPPPPGAAPDGHWHGDEWHAVPHAPPPKIKRVRTKTNTRQNRTQRNIGSILSSHTHPNPPPPLPADIQARLDQIYLEMRATRTYYDIRTGCVTRW